MKVVVLVGQRQLLTARWPTRVYIIKMKKKKQNEITLQQYL